MEDPHYTAPRLIQQYINRELTGDQFRAAMKALPVTPAITDTQVNQIEQGLQQYSLTQLGALQLVGLA